MNRFARILLTGILPLLLAGVLPAWAGYEELFQTVKNASWAIYVREVGGMKAICSAGAFETTPTTTKLITAGHCFIGSDLRKTDFLVTQDHKRFVKAELVTNGLKMTKTARKATSTDLDDFEGDDWAIIRAHIGNQAVMPIGDSDALVIGEDLIIVGLPFGVDFLAVQGIVGSKDLSLSTLVWNHYPAANVFVAGGNSGSAVVSTRQKAIVGIVVAGPGAQSSMMIFFPINALPKDTR